MRTFKHPFVFCSDSTRSIVLIFLSIHGKRRRCVVVHSRVAVLLCCRCEIHYSVFATHARRWLLVTFEH